MKREKLENYLGCSVEVILFDNTVCRGTLHKTDEPRFKYDPNLYLRKNFYLCTMFSLSTFAENHSCLFRCSHVKKVNLLPYRYSEDDY